MRRLGILRLVLILVGILPNFFFSADAKAVSGSPFKYLIGPPESWVKALGVPSQRSAGSPTPRYVLLSDTQLLVGVEQRKCFYHTAAVAVTPQALSEIAQLQITFDPSYQQLTLHSLRLIRDGKAIDKLSSSQVRLLQHEKELELRVITGIVTAFITIDDLRVGDIVDISFTISGENPIYFGKISETIALGGDTATALRQVRLIAPPEMKLNKSVIGVSPEYSERIDRGMRESVWRLVDKEGVRNDQQYPVWFNPVPFLQISEYSSWRDVGAWAQRLYPIPSKLSPQFFETVQRFRNTGVSTEDHIRAAVRFVQNEINYFSVSQGERSHRAAHPNDVLSRRQGDCKDKALLLVTILHYLGVESRLALVSSIYGKALDSLLPSPNVFDHVIVRISLGGRYYWIDATSIGQEGSLAKVGGAEYFGKALVISDAEEGLASISADGVSDSVSITENFIIEAFDKPARASIVTTYSGRSADIMRSLYFRKSQHDFEHARANQLWHRYPKAFRDAPIDVQVDGENNLMVIRESYVVPELLERNVDRWIGFMLPTELAALLDPPVVSVRNGPLAVQYPFHGSYEFTITLPTGTVADAAPSVANIQSPFLDFNSWQSATGNVTSGKMTLTSLQDAVPVEAVGYFVKDLQKIRRVIGRVLSVPAEARQGQ